MLDFSGYDIPEHTQAIIKRYIEDGRDPGDFIYSVMSNNLFSAVGCADRMNSAALRDIVMWTYNRAPQACYGSEAKVMKWMAETAKTVA